LSARIRDHIRSNVVGYIALFLTLSTGSAVALSGSNTVFSDDVVNDQVYSADVRDDTLSGGGLSAADLRPGSVGTSEVAADSLGTADLAPGSVASSEVADDSLGAGDLAPDSVASSEVAADSLTTGDLAPGSVASSEVAADSLMAGDLAAGSVGSSEVAADSLGAGDLAAGSVGSSEVANDSLTGSDIVEASLGSVGSANFAGDSALLDGFDSSEFLSTSSGGTVNGSVTLNSAAGADLELGEATLFRNSGTDETFTMNNPGAGDLNLFVGGQITASGYINFPTISGSAPLSTDCDDASEAGRAVVRTDGTTNLYLCRGATGWIGK
jgi:hypothetical protein